MSDEAKKETTDTSAYTEIFDKKEFFDAEILPLMKKIQELCDKNGLPYMLWVIHVSNEEGHYQAITMNATGRCAKKMQVLGNIADGTISLKEAAALMLILSDAVVAKGGDK